MQDRSFRANFDRGPQWVGYNAITGTMSPCAGYKIHLKDLPIDEIEEEMLTRFYKNMNNMYPGNDIGPIYTKVWPAPSKTTCQAIIGFNTANEASQAWVCMWSWGYSTDEGRKHVILEWCSS